MWLNTFKWVLRSARYSMASARAFSHLHTAEVLTKKAGFQEGSLEVQYRNAFFNPREGTVIPSKAYCERWLTGWIKRWSYLSARENSSLKSSGEEARFVTAPVIQLDDGIKFRSRSLPPLPGASHCGTWWRSSLPLGCGPCLETNPCPWIRPRSPKSWS